MSDGIRVVGVETIRVLSKAERRAQFIAQSAREANEIARKHNARTAANRKKKHGTRNKP